MDKDIKHLSGNKNIDLKICHLRKDNFKTIISPSNTCSILLCDKGNCHITLRQNLYEIKSKTLMYTYLPFTLAKESLSDDFKGIYITYRNHFAANNTEIFKYISPYIFVMLENPVLELTEKKHEWLKSFCECIFRKQELEEEQTTKETFNQISMVAILAEIRNLYKEFTENNSIQPHDMKYNRSMQITRDFFNLLIPNFIQHHDIGFYAEKMSVSPKHLSASLKDTTGQTATKFISNMIIMEAKQQLISSNKTVQQIAFDLNFPNASFFGKFFKKNTGMSPNSFRFSHENILKKI